MALDGSRAYHPPRFNLGAFFAIPICASVLDGLALTVISQALDHAALGHPSPSALRDHLLKLALQRGQARYSLFDLSKTNACDRIDGRA